jgi:hypothetical protein
MKWGMGYAIGEKILIQYKPNLVYEPKLGLGLLGPNTSYGCQPRGYKTPQYLHLDFPFESQVAHDNLPRTTMQAVNAESK